MRYSTPAVDLRVTVCARARVCVSRSYNESAHGPKAFAKFDRIHELFTAIILFHGSTAGQLSIEAQVMLANVFKRVREDGGELAHCAERTNGTVSHVPSERCLARLQQRFDWGRKTDWDAFESDATGTTAMARTKKEPAQKALQNRDRSHGAKEPAPKARQSRDRSQNRDRSHRAPGGQPPADCPVLCKGFQPNADRAKRLVCQNTATGQCGRAQDCKRFLRYTVCYQLPRP